MEQINPKKPKESARDRHLKWINYYGSKNFGIWVECTECKKWRRTLQYSESHEVPGNWCCSMLTLESGEKGSCNDPEEENAEQYLDYSPGSIVWAKVEGYPWWPGIVDGDPDTDEYSCIKDDTLSYNVTFLDEKPTHAWIPKMFICPFLEPPKVKKGFLEKLRQNKYAKAISKAKKRAEAAMKMTIKDRLQTYSFVHLYKGHWPTTPNSEKCDIEENGSRNVEDKADILLKEPDELGPSDSTNTDDKRIEKDFSRKENNTAEERKLISKTPDILSLEKKTCNKKLLNNEDFIPESEGVFPFMEKKDSKYSSSVKKTSSNAKHQTESITSPLQEKEAKGIKRKANRKFTPRKKKTFEKPSESLTDDIIDSEHEGDEDLNAVSVPKEDDHKSIHALEERSVAKSNENGLPEVPNYQKHSPEKQTNNVKSLDEKKLKKKTNLVECAESITDPVQEKEAKGIKRKANRKFTPRKEMNFEKPSQSFTDDIIDLKGTDSEHEGDENLNTVSVPKEDDSKSIHSLEERSIAESNENVLPEEPNYEKHSTEKQTNNVKPLNEKKLKKKTNISTDKTAHSSHLLSKEEIVKHVDEAISTVLEFVENENLETFDEYNSSDQKKMKTSNELQKKNIKQKKCQNSLENIKQSNRKISIFEENITQISQVSPETKVLPNVSNSTSKINKQIIAEAPNSQKNIKPKDGKMNGFPKQPTGSFSVPVKDSVGRNDEVVVDNPQKDTTAKNVNKVLKHTPQNPQTIVILL